MEDALVKTFVVTADQDQIPAADRKILRQLLGKSFAAGAHGYNQGLRQLFFRLTDGCHHRRRLQHHPGAAAKRRIIHGPVLIRGKIPGIDAGYAQKPGIQRPFYNAVPRALFNLFRK